MYHFYYRLQYIFRLFLRDLRNIPFYSILSCDLEIKVQTKCSATAARLGIHTSLLLLFKCKIRNWYSKCWIDFGPACVAPKRSTWSLAGFLIQNTQHPVYHQTICSTVYIISVTLWFNLTLHYTAVSLFWCLRRVSDDKKHAHVILFTESKILLKIFLTVEWKIAISELAGHLGLNVFGVNQKHFHPFLLSISCVCCAANANPLKLLHYKVSLLKPIIRFVTVQRQ